MLRVTLQKSIIWLWATSGVWLKMKCGFDDVLVAEGEEIGGGFVHRIVPEILRNIRHGSLFSHRLSQESNTSIAFADGMSTFVFVRFERLQECQVYFS